MISPSIPSKRRQHRVGIVFSAFCLLISTFYLLPSACPQSITTRDGQVAQTQGIRREGATVFARVQTAGGNVGEVGYPVANIAKIDFPDPPQLKTADELLDASKASEAATLLAPAVAYYGPFRDIPGNWWLPLATLQFDALARLGRDREMDALAAELTKAGTSNPGLLRTIKIKQAVAAERRGEHHPALAALEPIVNDKSAPPDELVEGWLAVGSAHLALHDYKEALRAFLHVPVYTPDRAPLMAPALLGSAKAYLGLDDKSRARAALKQLLADYPGSTEAAEAKDRLQKLDVPATKQAGS